MTGDRLLTNGLFVSKEVFTRLLLLVKSIVAYTAKWVHYYGLSDFWARSDPGAPF